MLRRTLTTSTQSVSTIKNNIKVPENLKEPLLQKWSNYWKNLLIDYRQMLRDLRSDIQDNPNKAFKWTIALTTGYLLLKSNPNEDDFKDAFRRSTNEAILVSEKCRNPVTIEHLRFLQTSYNEGVIKYMSLGIASVMYISEFNDSCSLYKAQCSYLQPSYFNFPSKIVDIGMMGTWWNIYAKTADYDVNKE